MIKKILNEATVSDAVDNAEKVLDKPDVYSGQGDIEKALDRALATNRRLIARGSKDFNNVLFVGAAGTGKTARITAWAKKNNINLVKCLASTMDDTDLGGVIAGDLQNKSALKLATTQFDELGTEKDAVLFLDEWNRAPTTVRGTLLTLIQNHEIPDPRVKGGARFLPNFMFTVAAINPADANYNTDKLDDAELGRVRRVYVKSDLLNFLQYLESQLNKFINETDNPEDKKVFQGQLGIAEKLLKDPRFTLDDQTDIEQSHEAEENGKGNGLVLNSRSFTNCLYGSDGTKNDFLDIWNDYCNSLKKQTVKEILKDYKDVDDKANDALKSGTESSVFASRKSNIDALRKKMFGN